MENKCKNNENVIAKAKITIDKIIEEKITFETFYNTSYSAINNLHKNVGGSIATLTLYLRDKGLYISSSIITRIGYLIIYAILFIAYFIFMVILAIFNYLQNNTIYQFMNIRLFDKNIDDTYYTYFLLLQDALKKIKKENNESKIEVIRDNIKKILKDNLEGYLINVGTYYKKYEKEKQIRLLADQESKRSDDAVDIADQTNKTAGQNATTSALAQIIAASIKAGSKSAATGLAAGLAALFGNWTEVFAGFVIVLVCIILIILFITGIYKPLEDIDKRIVDQIEEKKKKFNFNKDDTLLSSLSQISLQFELLFEKIQNAYKSFLEKLEFFNTFSNELISDARNYSLYPIETERESNEGICDNIYTFDYNFIMTIQNNDIDEIYKGKGGAKKVILLIKPMELQDHAKEIYGPEAIDEVTSLNANLDLDLDADKNYKYKISCGNPDNSANIFDATCKVNDIECTGDQPDVSNDYDGIN
jgi:hypothetical protein